MFLAYGLVEVAYLLETFVNDGVFWLCFGYFGGLWPVSSQGFVLACWGFVDVHVVVCEFVDWLFSGWGFFKPVEFLCFCLWGLWVVVLLADLVQWMAFEAFNVVVNIFALEFQEAMCFYWGFLWQWLMWRSLALLDNILFFEVFINIFRKIRESHDIFLAFVIAIALFIQLMNRPMTIFLQFSSWILYFHLWNLINVRLSQLRNGYSRFFVTMIARSANFFMLSLAVGRHWGLRVIFLIT